MGSGCLSLPPSTPTAANELGSVLRTRLRERGWNTHQRQLILQSIMGYVAAMPATQTTRRSGLKTMHHPPAQINDRKSISSPRYEISILKALNNRTYRIFRAFLRPRTADFGVPLWTRTIFVRLRVVWVRRGYCGLSTHMTKQQEFPQHTMLNQTKRKRVSPATVFDAPPSCAVNERSNGGMGWPSRKCPAGTRVCRSRPSTIFDERAAPAPQ